MPATFVTIQTRIPNNAPLSYLEMDNNLTTLQQNMPIGAYLDYPATDEIPPTWLECNGSSTTIPVTEADPYYQLYQVLGTAYNHDLTPAGEFSLPDTRGLFFRHLDPENAYDPEVGRLVGGLQNDQVKSHDHRVPALWADKPTSDKQCLGYIEEEKANLEFDTDNSGGEESRPKNIAVIRIMKALSTELLP